MSEGYRGPALEVLERFECRVWSEVEMQTRRGPFTGIVLPRSETADDKHIVLKLHTGYNVGVASADVEAMSELGRQVAQYKIPEQEFPKDPGKPRVKLLGTGGTIASRLDYRTGAVIPAFSPGELYGAVPELADYCNLETEKVCGVFSENIGYEHWKALAERVRDAAEEGFDGVVIGHGTDTLHHTAAALSFMLEEVPFPVVLVGSQRSSDRPSSDAARNLIAAVRTAAEADLAEVVVCMYGPTSDLYHLLHRGTRVRKMHSSTRSTFRTLGDRPAGLLDGDKFEWLKPDVKRRNRDGAVRIDTAFEERIALVYYYPNMQPDHLEALLDKGYRGIAIAGTGLGHVNTPCYDVLERAKEMGVLVVMTVQTLWGYCGMYVYDTGRDLMEKGVVPLGNMLPEVAYVKLGCALGRFPDDREAAVKYLQEPVVDEITLREPHDGYLVFQGGTPEMEGLARRFLK
ncbi:MAG: Glu-tRNA(Gln) amidotransferase subunit GatD [Planctomycetota bacterium]|jgi:glutamyl-tRNA(Gln) amidotransferase subunit D